MTDQPLAKPKFPATFWTANTIELFERAAYYSMASFMVIYLKEILGMTPSFATFLNGSLLWGIIYFMPILSGTLADKFGFKRSLSVSFVLISLGYFVMGNVQRLWPGLIGRGAAEAVDFTVPVVLGIVLIGLGGSIVKPCIAGTVQKTAGTRATLAFGIFYMVINIGSITGRSVSYFIRTSLGIPAIFTYAATSFALIGLLVTLLVYKEPQYVSDGIKDGQEVRKRTLGQALAGHLRRPEEHQVRLPHPRPGHVLVPLHPALQPHAPVHALRRPDGPDGALHPGQSHHDRLLPAAHHAPGQEVAAGQDDHARGDRRDARDAGQRPAAPALRRSQRQDGRPRPEPAHRRDLHDRLDRLDGRGRDDGLAAHLRVHRGHRPQGAGGAVPGLPSLPIALASIIGGPIGGRMFERYINTPLKEGRPVDTVTMWLIIVAIGVGSIIGLAIYDRMVVKGAKKA